MMEGVSGLKTLDSVERQIILDAVSAFPDKKQEIAEGLGICLKTLYNKMKKHKIRLSGGLYADEELDVLQPLDDLVTLNGTPIDRWTVLEKYICSLENGYAPTRDEALMLARFAQENIPAEPIEFS